MKATIRRILPLVFILVCALPVGALSATSAVVMEASSGRVLYTHNGDEVRSIASITKLMTALVAIEENDNLQTVVTIGRESCGIEGSSLYLREGEEITLEALLYGLMLRSGNDSAHAIAVHTAGSVEAFAALMNAKAVELGMVNSHFMNPNGLEEDGHYSSARDMALLGCACLQNPKLAEIVATQTIAFGDRVFQNHNKLLWQYEGCVGMKTGYTEKAGRTLVSAATRNEISLVAVTLNAPDDWADHTALLDTAFSAYQMTEVIASDTVVAKIPTEGALVPFVPVVTKEKLQYPIQKGEHLTYTIHLDVTAITTAVTAGERAGTVALYFDEIPVGEYPLYYGATATPIVVVPETTWQKFCHIFGQ